MFPDATVRSALHLAAIVESSDDAIVSKDLDGIVTSWNRAATRMFGYDASEVIGRSIRILIPPERQTEEDEVLARIRSGNVVDHFETVRLRKDGSCIDISLTVSPIRGHDGTIIGASKIARDITERKRIEAAIAAAEVQSRLLADLGEELAKSLDHRKILGAAARLFVPDFADWCAIDLTRSDGEAERYPADAPQAFISNQVIRTGVPVVLATTICLPLRTRAGVSGAVTFANTESGRSYDHRHLRFAEAVVDRLSLAFENARAFEEAREANRLKDDFLATLSHELRTPLNAILGYTRMMRTGSVAPDRRDAAMEVVERNATSLAQIVNDLLDIARIVAGKMAMTVQPASLSVLINDSIATVGSAARAKGLEIRTRLAPDIRTIVVDTDRMQQVLWNVLSNAVKFTPPGGLINVEGRRLHGYVEIAVADTGEGIPKEFLPFVFDRFRQADTKIAGVRTGLGIGLAIARHIVEMHGGTIEATSAGPGKGSTFRVKLPIAATSSQAAPAR